MKKYDPKSIEPKWQKIWQDTGIYSVDLASKNPKFYGFGMFNYPSGAGIHVGHVRNYTISDVITRFKRQQGHASYQPVGWDSFGLPAENFAIKTGVSPQESTKKAIAKYQKQYRAMGWAVDWSKEINTTDPEYYKWTQWIFTKLFEHKLAYQKESAQWWCDQCKTVLADEQVINGKCWRHDGPDDPLVTKKNLKQWFFKITDYADEMLKATDDLNWTQSVKASQKSWIGRSQGVLVKFPIEDSSKTIEAYTTRIDTIYSGTFIVLAPENPLIKELSTNDKQAEVEQYTKQAVVKTDVDRQEAKEKTGVFTGSYATNPASGERMPIWVADFVLGGYGTGAVFGDGHDERDVEFAMKHKIPLKTSVEPVTGSEQKEPKEKGKIVALVENAKGEVLTINWGPKLGGRLLVGGTVEEGEDPVKTAKREVAEETGYADLELIEIGDETIHHHYYAHSKKQATIAHTKAVHFRLKSDNRQSQQLEDNEKDKFKVEWISKDKAETEVVDPLHRYVYDKFVARMVFTGDGVLYNSDQFDGMSSVQAREKITEFLSKKGLAKPEVQYKMRDWLISRQRYWGAPIPIIHCEEHGAVAVPEKDLPVLLPEIKDYQPTGGNVSVLAGVEGWVNAPCPTCGKMGKRETDTMDGYVCSSWYFLRYLSPHDDTQAWDPALTKKWMPVDFYNGGDHATAHLLYARFFTRFFHKLGLVDSPEPFDKMVYNGKIKAPDGSAFSKSKGNGVDPLEVIEQNGADALRLYEMFAAPVEQDVLWDPQGVPGAYRFLSRVWSLTQAYMAAEGNKTEPIAGTAITRSAHKSIKKVTQDIGGEKFNTAIAAIMEATNEYYKHKSDYSVQKSPEWTLAIESLLQILAPFVPHIAEELWEQLGRTESIHLQSWPKYDPELVKDDVVTIVVQVNGKLRGEFVVEAGADAKAIETEARIKNDELSWTSGAEIVKAVVVPGRLVNFVTKQ
ncbi:class I tRNA ligase family protein [Candidatus Saccharibacteria bacterium]|nr:class I tRNA ligase family protein [Candidatus Saccharibacteria bacterium]